SIATKCEAPRACCGAVESFVETPGAIAGDRSALHERGRHTWSVPTDAGVSPIMGLCRLLYLSGHCASGLSVSALSSPEIAFPAISISRACSTCRRARTIVAVVVADPWSWGSAGEVADAASRH